MPYAASSFDLLNENLKMQLHGVKRKPILGANSVSTEGLYESLTKGIKAQIIELLENFISFWSLISDKTWEYSTIKLLDKAGVYV